MSLLAQFEETGVAADRRSSDRRELRLKITASLPESPELAVTIYDLSETGLLLETRVPLETGQTFQIFLPLAGAVDTTVMWRSHQFYGCQFGQRVSRAAVSAALLQSAPKGEPADTPQPQDVLSQLRDVNARIERVGQDLDRTIEQLSSGRTGVQQPDPEAVLAAALPRSPILLPPEADRAPEGESERYVEQVTPDVRASSLPVVIISLILAGLAALILIAALLALPLSS